MLLPHTYHQNVRVALSSLGAPSPPLSSEKSIPGRLSGYVIIAMFILYYISLFSIDERDHSIILYLFQSL